MGGYFTKNKISFPKKALKTETVSSLKISLGKVCMRQGQRSTYFGLYQEVL